MTMQELQGCIYSILKDDPDNYRANYIIDLLWEAYNLGAVDEKRKQDET